MADRVNIEDFEKLSRQFLRWLDQNGTNISAKVELADLRSQQAGRGVLAKEDIDEDEELFSIPQSSVLTIETSGLPVEIKEKVDDSWLLLILAMVYEYQRCSESPWKPYFDILPQEFDTLMYWSDSELKSLQGSAVVDKIGKQSADQTFTEQLIPIMRQRSAEFKTDELNDDDLLSLCHRMGSTIMAYAFDLEQPSADPASSAEDGWEEESDAGELLPKGMVPLADMLNADADRNNAKLFYADDKVVMKAIRAIQKGEEIFNDYGPLPRADVLRRYGYVTENYAKYDVVEISLELIKEAAMELLNMQKKDVEARVEYLNEKGALDDGYDIFRASNIDGPFGEELSVLQNSLMMSEADFDKLKKKQKLPKPDMPQATLQLLRYILVRRRSMYPQDDTSSNWDNTKLQNGHFDRTSTRRRKMAAGVITGEKEVLKEATETVRGLLGDNKKRKAETLEDKATEMQQSSKRKKGEHPG